MKLLHPLLNAAGVFLTLVALLDYWYFARLFYEAFEADVNDAINWMGGQEEMANWAVALWTAMLAAITAYYAWQTWRMVEEMRRQSRPYLYIIHDEHWLKLKNDGTRSAHDIRIEVLRDSLIPKQLRPYSEVTIRKSNDPPAPPPRQATTEEVIKLRQGTENLSDQHGIKNPPRTLVPGGTKILANVGRYIGANQPEQFEYKVSYSDPVGLRYEEGLTLEYNR